MNLRVNLTKRVQTDAGLRYYPAVISGNGRVKPDWVVIDGQEVRVPGGAYYLEWRDGGKRVRRSVGKDAAQANNQKLRKEAELNAVSKGVSVTPEQADGATGKPLDVAVAEYLEATKLSKKPKTFAAYTTTLTYLKESCNKQSVESIERGDMLKFAAFLKGKGLAPRTCWNYFNNAMSFLKANGVRGIVHKSDWPKFTQEEPEIYEKEDLDTLFAACSPDERLWFEFYLMTGMREQEVIYSTWPDVNFTRRTVTVRWKPEYNWTPKAYKEREIPIPEKLCHVLKAAKAKSVKMCPLVFPTSGGLPKFDALHVLKAVAKKAGLNPDEFWLHKFRSTFCTWALWAGVDLRTCQLWMGHVDIESTMRYLKPSRSEETRAKVDAIFA